MAMLEEIEKVYALCDKHDLKKAMTLIIGLGETIDDFESLKKFIKKNGVSRITFYSLNPQEGTIFRESPKIDYYTEWIAKTRIAFPGLEMIAGAWIDKAEYFSQLLKAGANSITKIPALKAFGNERMRLIEKTISSSGRKFVGSLTKLPEVDWNSEIEKLDVNTKTKKIVEEKLNQYLKKII